MKVASLRIVGLGSERRMPILSDDREFQLQDKISIQPQRLSRNDTLILDLLKQDARRTVTEISAIVGVSRTTVKERIDLLRDRGVIKRFTIETGEHKSEADYLERAFFLVRLKRSTCRMVHGAIRHWPELVGCWSIAGDLDMMVLVDAPSIGEIERLRDILARHSEVQSLQTLPVLRDWVEIERGSSVDARPNATEQPDLSTHPAAKP